MTGTLNRRAMLLEDVRGSAWPFDCLFQCSVIQWYPKRTYQWQRSHLRFTFAHAT